MFLTLVVDRLCENLVSAVMVLILRWFYLFLCYFRLKPQVKRAAVGMTNENLAGFLKSMAGREMEAVEELENVIFEEKEVWFLYYNFCKNGLLWPSQ